MQRKQVLDSIDCIRTYFPFLWRIFVLVCVCGVLFVFPQDRVLFVAFYVLLNLAEDVTVERKMVKKGLIDFFFGRGTV